MKRVVLVTGHYFESKRKAGFHWLAEAFWEAGWDVTFLTVSISWLSYFSKDHRLSYPVLKERNKLKLVRDRLYSYVWFTPWHPAHLRSKRLNRLATSWYSQYGDLDLGDVSPQVQAADTIIFESNLGLLLFDRFREMNPKARYVYRVSDDLKLLRNHPIAIEVESRSAKDFDLISTPSEYIYRQFSDLPQARLHPHGLAKELFDHPHNNPYSTDVTNLVFVGNSHFDYEFLNHASDIFPKWKFHIIGPIEGLPKKHNIVPYGEMPFKETIPYLKHADIGLQIRAYSPGAESLTDSLKMSQYTYCKLPIVAPEFLRSSRPNAFYYLPGDTQSIRVALTDAAEFDRTAIDTSQVLSWSEIAAALTESSDDAD